MSLVTFYGKMRPLGIIEFVGGIWLRMEQMAVGWEFIVVAEHLAQMIW